MADHSQPTRRTVLAAGGATAGAVALGAIALTGCGATSGNSDAGGTGDAGSAPAAGQSPSGDSKPGTKLVSLGAVPVGGAVAATGPDGAKLIVAQPSDGKAVAFSAICTHQGCTVAPAGKRLNCPCHGSVYDALTGKNLSGPAPRPLPSFAVHVESGNVLTGT